MSDWCTTCIAAAHPKGEAMNVTIDETVERVEQLYTTLTGKRPPAPNGHGAAIPPESDPMLHVEQQVGRMVAAIERLLPRPTTPTASAPAWTPGAIVWARESELVLSLDVPGVSREDIQIRVQPLALTVIGQRRVPWTQQPPSIASCDAPLGEFARSFPLGAGITPDHVSARLEAGVLTVRVHSGTRAEPSQIPITS